MNKLLRLAVAVFGLFALSIAAGAAGAVSGGAYQRMVAKLQSVKTYKATIHAKYTLEPIKAGAKPNSIDSVETLLYKRPNKLALQAKGLMGGFRLVSNGKTLYQYSALANQYTQKPAPTNLLSVLLASAGAASSFRPAGTSRVDGAVVDVLKGTVSSAQGDVRTTLYIGRANGLPYRIVAVLPHLPGPQGGNFRMVSEEDFSSQSVNAPIPNSAFQFVPPAGASRVSSLGLGPSAGPGSALPGFP